MTKAFAVEAHFQRCEQIVGYSPSNAWFSGVHHRYGSRFQWPIHGMFTKSGRFWF
jgi:hypothetical protein